ncbi:predicted protein [Uncinocarpus reesii 1704]|uniref:Uncharacterized protein n=1 Tax=Uncinocarpus reesii (strain UAMH 1704) TaxID=336963 RepID=C4JHL1_UNCRE|nr:uncharacterized protein UREG_01374 [Uncinocarpus reesii 1704]EEP76525.1 predicted protein [Uncinocarpus reesii 1704]
MASRSFTKSDGDPKSHRSSGLRNCRPTPSAPMIGRGRRHPFPPLLPFNDQPEHLQPVWRFCLVTSSHGSSKSSAVRGPMNPHAQVQHAAFQHSLQTPPSHSAALWAPSVSIRSACPITPQSLDGKMGDLDDGNRILGLGMD